MHYLAILFQLYYGSCHIDIEYMMNCQSLLVFIYIVFSMFQVEILGYYSSIIITPHQLFRYQFQSSSSSIRVFPLYNNKKGKGYQFGDISKSVYKSFGKSVNKITRKDSYEFGDLTKWLDSEAKSKVQEFTNKDGDYEFGDISKEIIRRVKSGEYTVDDILFLCKILVSLGMEFKPVASVLPVKVSISFFLFIISHFNI